MTEFTGTEAYVDEVLPGDYVLHYHGPDVEDVRAGDYLVVREGEAVAGDLVTVDAGDGVVALRVFEPGLAVLGVVTGLMRRLGDG